MNLISEFLIDNQENQWVKRTQVPSSKVWYFCHSHFNRSYLY